MASVSECLALAEKLAQVSDTPRLDTELLLGNAIGKTRTWLFTWPEYSLSEQETARFLSSFARRREGEPVAYILGEKEFWSLPLYVNTSTLIPRPETELLVATLLELPGSKRRILDLGTGTGAIALALASELPESEIIAVDASDDVIELAKRNRQRLGFEQVQFFTSDWFSALKGETFDVIVSNPPYIADTDPHLTLGDVRFEPRSALVAANRGMADIRHIITQSPGHLNPGGTLMLEHGWQQDEVVSKMFKGLGFNTITTLTDLAGNNRMTMGQLHG